AIDHGIETPAERQRAGKPPEGTIRLEARHSAGMLLIHVSDDGKGIHLESLREAVVRKKLTNAETAAKLIESELLDFLFLPVFSASANWWCSRWIRGWARSRTSAQARSWRTVRRC